MSDPPVTTANLNRSRWPMLIAFVLVLVGIEALSRTAIGGLAYRGGPLALVQLADALEALPVSPSVVFLGASHTQCAIVPAAVERPLGLVRGSVVSGGRNNGGIRESLFVYETARRSLRRARLVVIDVGDRDFNVNLAVEEMKGPAPWRRHAGLADRLSAPADAETRWDWTLGWAWATWDQRATWRDVVGLAGRAIGRGFGASPPSLFEADGRAVVAEERTRMSNERLAADAEKAAARHMQRYRLDDEAIEVLARFVALIQADGPRVLLAEYPVSPAYRDVVASRYAREDRLWREAVAARLPQLPVVSLQELVDDFGPTDFRDADHLSRRGADRFSVRLAERFAESMAGL
jgi:hypothetical protein